MFLVLIGFFVVVVLCVESLGFSTSKIMLSTNKDSFTSSIPMGIHLYKFLVLIVLSKTCGIILSRVVRGDIPALFLKNISD